MKTDEEIEQIKNELEDCSCNLEIDSYIGGLCSLLLDAVNTINQLQKEKEDLEKNYL